MKRQWLIGIAVTALVAGLTSGYGILEDRGATSAGNEPEIVLCYGEVDPEGHAFANSAQYFANRVSELTGGKVMVEIYPPGQLGDDARCYQSIGMEALDSYRGNGMSLVDSGNPIIPALVLPYASRDRERLWKACGSDLGREMLDSTQNCTGMVDLAYLDEGARNFLTTDRPVCRLEGMKGLKIQVQVVSMMDDTVEALGMEAVPIAYAEPYTIPKSGIVDGAKNPPVSYYYNKFYRTAPYYVEDRHAYTPGAILVSRITWRNLEKEYQDALVQVAKGTREYNRTATGEADQKAYEASEKEGVTILKPKDPQVWSQVMKPVYRKYDGEYLDLIEKIRQIRQTYV